MNLAGTLNQDREAMCQRLRQALEGKIQFRSCLLYTSENGYFSRVMAAITLFDFL